MSYGYPSPSDQPPPQQPGQYPTQPGPTWGTPMPPPKKTNRAGLIAVLGCAGVLVLAMLGGAVALMASGGDSSDDASGSSSVTTSPSAAASSKAPGKTAPAPKGEAGDVKVTGCAVNATTTWPAADVEIVNHSGSKANYIVSIEFLDGAGTRLGEGMAATNNLAPGKRAKAKAQGLAETSGKVTCKVADVTRYPSG